MKLVWMLLLLLVTTEVFAQATVAGRLRQYGLAARGRLKPFFTRCGVPFPPKALTLVGVKDQNRLLLYAPDSHGAIRFIRDYPILAASGVAGPKLQEGDMQVPEGIYRITTLNPNSAYHLSMRVSYPNAFDRAMARQEGRTHLGGDIMIHGNAVSAGCLAMGDEAAEDLFVLVADTGMSRITVILTPVDFRTTNYTSSSPAWVATLYADIQRQLARYPLPPKANTNTPAPQHEQGMNTGDRFLQRNVGWRQIAAAIIIFLLVLCGLLQHRATQRKRRLRREQRAQWEA